MKLERVVDVAQSIVQQCADDATVVDWISNDD